MVSPVRGDYRRCQAETPLIDLFKFAGPALSPSCENCGCATVKVGKLSRLGLHPLINVYKCQPCRQIISITSAPFISDLASDLRMSVREDSRMAEAQTHVFRVSLSRKVYRDFEMLSATRLEAEELALKAKGK
jgi:hypothetical protein